MRLIVNIDGAARGNPGPAAVGVRIVDEQGKPVAAISARIGERTNNQAEYEALLAALRELTRLRPDSAVIRTDSELLCYQMTGSYRVKNPELALLKSQADRLLAGLRGVRFQLVPREQNRAADRLANLAFKATKTKTSVKAPGSRGGDPNPRSPTPDPRSPPLGPLPSLFDES